MGKQRILLPWDSSPTLRQPRAQLRLSPDRGHPGPHPSRGARLPGAKAGALLALVLANGSGALGVVSVPSWDLKGPCVAHEGKSHLELLEVGWPTAESFCLRGGIWATAGCVASAFSEALAVGTATVQMSSDHGSRGCGRDGARGDPAEHHSAPARPRPPRRHLDLPSGHRRWRDHRHGPGSTSADASR
jgi:hypothetical protein